MEEDIRKIAIALDDRKTLKERQNLIYSDMPLSKATSVYDLRIAEKIVKWLEHNPDCGLWWYGEQSYPRFDNIEKRLPYFLFYRGTKPNCKKNRVAIVGTRHCDYEGFQKSFSLGLEFAVNNVDVVTGLADGCDQGASFGAVASKCPGKCYAVLGCGLDVDYPKLTQKLKSQIVDNQGAIISRFLPDEIPQKYHFPNRNVIVAAMSDYVIAVQAPEKSGTLITVDFALQMGKDIFVPECGIGEEVPRRGTTALVNDGAGIITNASDIVNCEHSVVRCTEKDINAIRFGSCFYKVI